MDTALQQGELHVRGTVRETLGAQAFAHATAEGAALDYEEALAEAQAWLEDPQRWAHAFEFLANHEDIRDDVHHATAFRQSGGDNSAAQVPRQRRRELS